jgi:hypothetical protein
MIHKRLTSIRTFYLFAAISALVCRLFGQMEGTPKKHWKSFTTSNKRKYEYENVLAAAQSLYQNIPPRKKNLFNSQKCPGILNVKDIDREFVERDDLGRNWQMVHAMLQWPENANTVASGNFFADVAKLTDSMFEFGYLDDEHPDDSAKAEGVLLKACVALVRTMKRNWSSGSRDPHIKMLKDSVRTGWARPPRKVFHLRSESERSESDLVPARIRPGRKMQWMTPLTPLSHCNLFNFLADNLCPHFGKKCMSPLRQEICENL